MTKKERVLRTIQKKPVDKLPFNFLAVNEIREKLIEKHGGGRPEKYLKYYNVDFVEIFQPEYLYEKPSTENHYEDYWGIHWRKAEYRGGEYWEPYDYPLNFVEKPSDLDMHNWPDPMAFDFKKYKQKLKDYSEFALYGGLGSVFFIPTLLREMSLIFVDMLNNPSLLEALIEKVIDFQEQYYSNLFSICADYLDVFFIADDYGTQNGLMFDVKLWRKFFKKPTIRLVELAKKFEKPVLFHCCGSIKKLIPDFIDIGIDILDPLQYNADDMDPVEIKKEFGKDLCFQGGIDTQKILSFGTPEEVREHTKRIINIYGEEGGYIIAPSHNIQVSTSIDNLDAFFETVESYR